MIGKSKSITHGKNAIAYAINKKDAKVIMTNNLSSYDAHKIYKEMKINHSKNSNCKNLFIRTEVSPHPKDGKSITEKGFEIIAQKTAEKLGLVNHQWVAVIHNDTINPHLHMIFNRVDYKSKVHNDSFISNRTSKAAEEIATEFKLTQAKDCERQIQNNDKKTPGEIEKQHIKEANRKALSFCKTYEEYQKFMENEDIEVILSIHKSSGKAYGHKIKYNGKYFKASQIDRKMSLKKIEKTLKLNHERQRSKTRNSFKRS